LRQFTSKRCALRSGDPTDAGLAVPFLGGADLHFGRPSRPTARTRDAQPAVGPVPRPAAHWAVRRMAGAPTCPPAPRPSATPPKRNEPACSTHHRCCAANRTVRVDGDSPAPTREWVPFWPGVTLGLSQGRREIRVECLPAADGGNMDSGYLCRLTEGRPFDTSGQDRQYGLGASLHVSTSPDLRRGVYQRKDRVPDWCGQNRPSAAYAGQFRIGRWRDEGVVDGWR
jgi:hypothetical protein